MKQLALDIWDDLREKRLWPVAAALVLALIAVPLFVIDPAEEPARKAAQPQSRQAQSTPAVGVVDDASRQGSHLDVFGRKDPFRPPAGALKPSTSTGSAVSDAPAGASAAPPAGVGSSGSAAAPSASGGSGSAGSGSAGSGSAGGGSAPAPSPVTRRPRTAYTYVVDIDFGREGHTRLRRGVPRLTALPGARSPVAVFLGVSASGKRGVFLLNAAFEQSGQGTCRPSRATCNLLYLSTDPAKNGHRLVDGQGTAYLLRLKGIRRVSVREASRASAGGPRARAGARARDFDFPLFADEQR